MTVISPVEDDCCEMVVCDTLVIVAVRVAVRDWMICVASEISTLTCDPVKGLPGGLSQHFALTSFMNAFSWFAADSESPELRESIAARNFASKLLVSP